VLHCAGFECEAHDVGVTVFDVDPEDLGSFMASISALPAPEEVAQFAENLRHAKYDDYVSEDLLRRDWVRRNRALWPAVEATIREAATPPR
jgi:ATP-dependent Lhr-like helicase